MTLHNSALEGGEGASSIRRLLDGDVVLHASNAFDSPGEVACAVLLVAGIDETARAVADLVVLDRFTKALTVESVCGEPIGEGIIESNVQLTVV